MRKLLTQKEIELNKVVEPYFVYENGGHLKLDAPEEVKIAYKELLSLGKEEMANKINML